MNRIGSSAFKSSLLIGAAMGVLHAPANGQTADSEPAKADITVTAIRQQYVGDIPVIALPQNVQSLSGKTMEQLNVRRLDEALDFVSGIARQNNFGGYWDSYAVRGFAGDINVPSGYLVNGFNYGRGFGGPRDVSNVERIDVLKGPTSALFGRGEPGGTVNIITKKPTFDTFGSLTLGTGNYDTFRGETDFSTDITDTLAFRINGAVEDADSFRDTVHTKKYFATPSVLWNIGDNTKFSYEVVWSEQHIPFDRGIVVRNGDFNTVPVNRFLGEPKDGPTILKDMGHQVQLQHDFSSDWGILIGGAYRKTKLDGIGENVELVGTRQPFLNGAEYVSRQRRSTHYRSYDYVARIELTGKFATGAIQHNIRLGADYDDFKLPQVEYIYRPPLLSTNPTFAQMNALDLDNPVYNDGTSLPVPTALNYNRFEHDQTWGVYFQDQIDLSDALKVRIGGRYDNFKQYLNNIGRGTVNRQHPASFSPQLGVVFQPMTRLSFYASYGRGFRSNTGADFAGDPFAPEKTKSYELGAKYISPGDAITATVALFRMNKDNIITSDPAHPGFVTAIGTARSQGVEIDIDARLPHDFHLIANYAHTDAESTSTVNDPDFGKLVEAGDPLINVPKNSANLILLKEFTIAGRKATLGAGVNYVDKRLGETGTNYYLPSYTLVRLLSSVDITDRLQLSGDIKNLFDKKWFASSYSALWTMPGAPRTFMVRATYRF